MWFSIKPEKQSSMNQFILFAGLDGAGKTLLARLLVTQALAQHAPTYKDRTEEFIWKSRKFKLIDTSGKIENRTRWSSFPCDAIIFFVDGTNQSRLAESKVELEKLVKRRKPIVVILNKADLLNFSPLPDLLNELGLNLIDPSLPVRAFECSVLKKVGYEDALDWLLRLM